LRRVARAGGDGLVLRVLELMRRGPEAPRVRTVGTWVRFASACARKCPARGNGWRGVRRRG